MKLTKDDIKVLESFMSCLANTCRDIRMDGRKTLPVGGKYPDERFIQFTLAGRQFGTVVYRDKDPWSIGIEVVEEIRSRKSHGNYYYREAQYLHMFFINGRINTYKECAEWGVCGDGYDIRLVDFDKYILMYMDKYQPEFDHIGGIPFPSMKKAPESYQKISGMNWDKAPQAEPNGLYTESVVTTATWILGTDENGDIKPIYTESEIMVSQFKIDARLCEDWSIPTDY